MSGSPVAGVLLAAGESARMGRPKAGLLWRGKTLLEYQTQSLQSAGLEPVIAVLGAHAAMVRDGVSPGTQTVVNEQWRDGRASSVRAGIKQVPDSAVAVVLLGLDQPRPSALIRAFVAQWRVSGQAIGVATHQGVEGHPVVFSKRLFGALGAVEESSLGLRAVLERNRADVARIEMGTEDVWLDLNSPADYEAALANRREDS